MPNEAILRELDGQERQRLIDRLIDACLEAGINEIYICLTGRGKEGVGSESG